MRTLVSRRSPSDRAATVAGGTARRASPTGRPSLAHCACGGGCPRCLDPHRRPTAGSPPAAQPPALDPLTVGGPADAPERQADAVAAAVMRGAAAALPVIGDGLNAPSTPRGREVAPVLAAQIASPGTAGSPLPAAVRAFMEPRFGRRFDHVRVHAGGEAARLNEALGARAFVHGHDLFFGAGTAPANDRLTAHELAHVVQQSQRGSARRVQRTTDDEAVPEAADESEAAQLVRAATQAIDDAGGQIEFFYAPAAIEGDSAFVLFEDYRVQALFRHLLRQWLGAAGTDEELENTVDPEAPRWVGEFRAKALNLRAARSKDADFGEQQQLATLALRLADAVHAETPAQGIRRLFVQAIDRRIGTTVMTQEAIDNERAKPAEGGLTPKNFTTCIAFFCQVVQEIMRQSDSATPLVKGPNHYKEIDPVNGKENLPPGAWRPCGGDARPKPGDLLIFSFAAAETLPSGVSVGKGWFAHISILRAIEPTPGVASDRSDPGYSETFVSVDGGGTTAKEVVRRFEPGPCLIHGPGTTQRSLRGWIDIEAMAEARIGPRTTFEA